MRRRPGSSSAIAGRSDSRHACTRARSAYSSTAPARAWRVSPSVRASARSRSAASCSRSCQHAAAAGQPARVALDQRVERAHHHLRVARARQPAPRVAQRGALAREGLRAELVSSSLSSARRRLSALRVSCTASLGGPAVARRLSSSIVRSSCARAMRCEPRARAARRPAARTSAPAARPLALAAAVALGPGQRHAPPPARRSPRASPPRASASGATMGRCPAFHPRHGGRCDLRRTASRRRIAVRSVVIICLLSASIC